MLARKYHIPIYCTKGTMEELKQMSMLGKMPEGLYRPILAEETFSIGDLSILPFEISHDAAEPVGYRVSHGEKSVGIATDMGVYDEDASGRRLSVFFKAENFRGKRTFIQ